MSETTVEKDLEKKAKAASKAAEESSANDDEDEEDDAETEETPGDGDDDSDDESDARAAKSSSEHDAVKAKPRSQLRVERSSASTWVRNTWTIARRELASYFNSPLAYIVISLSLVGFGVHFFLYQGGVWQIDRASTARLFAFAPGVLCFLTIPLFTMRSLSEEKRVGTLELLITLPVRDSEVILGKFFGAFGMLFFQIVLLVGYPFAMFVWPWHLGAFDWGPFWASMVGLLLMSSAGIALGVMFSGFTENQILSFFLTALTLAVLFYVGEVVQYVQGTPGDVISFFSFQTRFEPFARGIIDTRAVVYFLSITVIALLQAFRTLESRKWS